MQHPDIFFMLILVMIAALIVQYRSLTKKKFRRELEKNLNENHSLIKYKQQLESPKGKKYIRSTEAALLLLNAAIDLEQGDDVRMLIVQLDNTRMRSRDFIDYNMKKLAYGISKKDPVLAKSAWEILHNSHFAKYVKKEADQLYDIYVLHQANHIDELLIFADKAKNPSSKAMAYYRIAQQYHNIQNTVERDSYLRKARDAFPDKTWQTMLDTMLSGDLSQLD